jgi:hypothetical protein
MQLLVTPSIEDDGCAFLQEAARRASSNARAGPRYDDNFVFESIHDFSDETCGHSYRKSASKPGRYERSCACRIDISELFSSDVHPGSERFDEGGT